MINVNLGKSDIDLIKEALNEKLDTNKYLIANNEFFEQHIKEIENVRIVNLLEHLKGFE